MIHAAGIAMPAIDDDGDVDIDDVAIDQLLRPRNAVADHMVDRGADRFRKAAIIERRRNGVMGDDVIVAQLVQRLGGDARHDMRCDEIQRLGGQMPGAAHLHEISRLVQLDLAVLEPIVFRVFLLHRALYSLGR